MVSMQMFLNSKCLPYITLSCNVPSEQKRVACADCSTKISFGHLGLFKNSSVCLLSLIWSAVIRFSARQYNGTLYTFWGDDSPSF